MLADCPSNYMREPECMEFLSAVPTSWDETRVLNGLIGQYVTVARKKGDTWYIGSMTNWNPREMILDLTFLGKGTYEIVTFEDGINADRYGSDFAKKISRIASPGPLRIQLAPGGGWAAIVRKTQ
jgi:alpha-glucosidase